MLHAPKPSFFYGAATVALWGLASGLALHGPWQAREAPIGPQILFPAAQAAEVATPDGRVAVAQADSLQDDDTPLRDEYVAPTPLPVVRLAPEAQQAGVEEERTDAVADQGDDVQGPSEPAAD